MSEPSYLQVEVCISHGPGTERTLAEANDAIEELREIAKRIGGTFYVEEYPAEEPTRG